MTELFGVEDASPKTLSPAFDSYFEIPGLPATDPIIPPVPVYRVYDAYLAYR